MMKMKHRQVRDGKDGLLRCTKERGIDAAASLTSGSHEAAEVFAESGESHLPRQQGRQKQTIAIKSAHVDKRVESPRWWRLTSSRAENIGEVSRIPNRTSSVSMISRECRNEVAMMKSIVLHRNTPARHGENCDATWHVRPRKAA